MSRLLTARANKAKYREIIAGLNGSTQSEADYEQNIASEAAYRARNLHGTDLENLKVGACLREIATKAQEIAHKTATLTELQNLNQYTGVFIYSTGSILGALAIAIGLACCFVRYCAGKPFRDLMK